MFLNPLKHLQHQLWRCCWTEAKRVCLWREQAGTAYLGTQTRARGTLWMLWKRLYWCPTCKHSTFFTLWQRMSELIQEHHNFLPLLFFPFGLLGFKLRNPHNIPWSISCWLTTQDSARGTDVRESRTALPGPCHSCDQRCFRESCSHYSSRGEREEDTNRLLMMDILWVIFFRAAPFWGSRSNCQVKHKVCAAEHKSIRLIISTDVSPSNGKKNDNKNNETLNLPGNEPQSLQQQRWHMHLMCFEGWRGWEDG